jgi:prepilin-type N-terminal cleavage/methylation domain-containing protein
MKKRKAFTLVEIMIVVAVIALLAAMAIPNLLTARRTANEAAAKSNVQTIATAAETYAVTNNGIYPTQAQLKADYMKSIDNYCGNTTGGYTYACDMSNTTYTITGTPQSTNSGTKRYTATAGGQFTETSYP